MRNRNIEFKPDKIDYPQICITCENYIREGKMQTVHELLRDLNFTNIPRQYRFILSRICRRVGAISSGLRILKKIIFSQIPKEPPPTTTELCEYAVLLSRIGSVDEALKILEKLDTTTLPEIYLYKGFCLISQWNYLEASKHLETFLKVATDPYLLIVGKVNLASALVSARLFDEANALLNSLINSQSTGGNKRLLGNCFELRAQTHFHQGYVLKAEEDLSNALTIFKQTNSYDEILVQKWRAIIESYKQGLTLPLENFKKLAIKKAHWESVREIDLYKVKTSFNQKDFDYLYFGTPYSSFRSRLKNETKRHPSPDYYIGDSNGIQLCLATGEYRSKGIQKMNHKLQTLLTILCDDFYSPLSIGHLFTKVYPNEYFDIESSPLKIRQLISRLRKWFIEHKIKAIILEAEGRYSLEIKQGLGFFLGEERSDFEIFERRFAKLLQHFTDEKPFTAKDAESQLKFSRSDFHRTVSWAIKLNKIKKFGQGKSTSYKLNKPQSVTS